MLNVHGITVSGPTFPAQIWHSFMGTAIGNRPDVPFPPATSQPVWTSWRGQYQYSGAYGLPSTTGTTTGVTTTGSGTAATTRTQRLGTTTTPKATTVAPPPSTTTPPPPTEPTTTQSP
jgi:membrane peptidoglycan carboxypeptidase